ncbi:MAG: FMN-binding protein, partial [Planctomycetota bacterium]
METRTWVKAAIAAGFLLLVLAEGCALSGAAAAAAALREAHPALVEVRRLEPGPARPGILGLYLAKGPSSTLGYAVEERVTSRSGPFTILVLISPQLRVVRVQVLSYLGERGGEVRSAAFTRQFEGMGIEDPIRVGHDVDAITGATLSSRAVAGGV